MLEVSLLRMEQGLQLMWTSRGHHATLWIPLMPNPVLVAMSSLCKYNYNKQDLVL